MTWLRGRSVWLPGLAVALLLSACGWNDVERVPLSDIAAAAGGSAIVVFGVDIDSGGHFVHGTGALSRYDPTTGALDAGCWRYDRMVIPAAGESGVRYYAFRVPPASYIWSWNLDVWEESYKTFAGINPEWGNFQNLWQPIGRRGRYPYFEATVGKLQYLGDFVYMRRVDPRTARSAILGGVSTSADRVARFAQTFSLTSNDFSIPEWTEADTPPTVDKCLATPALLTP